MKNEKMNKVLGMLDEDVIADVIEGKRSTSAVLSRRKLMTALIAAALAVAILVSTAVITRRTGIVNDRVNVMPPVGTTVIKQVASSSQITSETLTSHGTYPTVQSEYVQYEPISYVVASGLEMDESLYNSLVTSDDLNRTWAIKVQVSPNLYLTKDYLALELESIIAEFDASRLNSIIGICEQAKENFDFDALYEQYKDVYELDELYKYFASGELDRDLLSSDVEALGSRAKEIVNECGEIREGYWSELEPIVQASIEQMGIPFVEENGDLVIFVTEGELLSLSGIEGLKFDNAYYKIDVNEFDPNAISERSGKRITKKLSDAFAQYEGEEVLFAVLVETAGVAGIVDKSAYEQEYLALFSELATRQTVRKLLENAAAKGGEGLDGIREAYGAETVDKYCANGSFDSALFDSDTAAINARINEMRTNLYGDNSASVYDAFKNQVRYIEITGQGSVVIYVTAAEFDALTAEGDFVYSLAA